MKCLFYKLEQSNKNYIYSKLCSVLTKQINDVEIKINILTSPLMLDKLRDVINIEKKYFNYNYKKNINMYCTKIF